MSRFSRYDTDEERLPEGMTRVGYDADTQVYTFRDSDGSYWESAPGNQYGRLTKVGEADPEADEPFLPTEQYHTKISWRSELRPFLNFGVIIGLSLLGLYYFLYWKAGSGKEDELTPIADCKDGLVRYRVQEGDTCWAIADRNGWTVEELLKSNEEVNCDVLKVGDGICIPGKDPVQ